MSAQHTPGPWVVSLHGAFFTDVRAGDEITGRRIAWTWVQNQPRTREGALRTAQENEANALLIAAAPDLLAVAEAALWEDDGLSCADALRAAIAKAKGEQP